MFALYLPLILPEVIKFSLSFTENIVVPLSIAINNSFFDLILAAIIFILALGTLIAPFFLNLYIVKHIQNEF
ncbi:TPA: hypothetical protein JI052_13260 [Acinetobacter baumannii]|nr:hypothetical protein [Acinetobacter baumannii]